MKELNWKYRFLGDHAISYYLPEGMDTDTSFAIKNFNDFIVSQKMHEIKDIIPSYNTLTLIYDIEQVNNPLAFANGMMEEFMKCTEFVSQNVTHQSVIDVPVCYEEMFGIDLKEMSLKLNLTVSEIIKIHSEKTYHIYCLGFMPGFAYMGDVPLKIQMPRHSKPRNKVFAGSIGIAGAQTGIYPMSSPGGWQIIGRTPLKIFDHDPTILSKFKMADQVKFYPISLSEFEALNQY
jgi:inhibitor of KinA